MNHALSTLPRPDCAGLGLLVVLLVSAVAARTEDSGASLPASRVPWTTSRVVGSPEPPAPYRTERAFPQLRFKDPVELVHAPGTDLLFLLEQRGRLWSFPPVQDTTGTNLAIDLRLSHPDLSMAYGVAFHPKFERNRFIYLCYVLKDGSPDGSRVSRFTVTNMSPPTLDAASEQVLITWLGGGHNGGSLHFGNDGYLYISTGDGKGPDPPDELNTGQDISDLLSSILRLDVDRAEAGRPYRIPRDNPFRRTPGARPEVWCYGLRNPWRMSFDRATGDLWVGDVGWELWEMIYRVQRGGNYGWSQNEGGKQIIKADDRRGPTPFLAPTALHAHSEAASITGGYVYRGQRLRNLRGAYVYGDYETGKIWALRHRRGQVTELREIADTTIRIVAFGEDRAGELYIVDYAAGTLHRLVPNEASARPPAFPRTLRASGLFADVATHRAAPGVVPFAVNAEMWSDGALAERLVALPGDSSIRTRDGWRFPSNAVLAKTLSLEMERGQPASRRRVETQLLHFTGDGWNAVTYRWNDAQTDAELVGRNGGEQVFHLRDASVPGGSRQQTWRFHSRAECLRCHNSWCGVALGFIPAQLNSSAPAGTKGDLSQLRALAQLKLLDPPPDFAKQPRLANPRDPSAALEPRARAYLHANCAHCHRQGAGGSVLVYMNHEVPLAKTALLDTRPAQGTFGLPAARVIAPGDPARSVLLCRMAKLGSGHMPYLGARTVDEDGVALLRDWVRQLPATNECSAVERVAVAGLHAAESEVLDLLGRGATNPPSAEACRALDQLLGTPGGALALLTTLDAGRLPTAAKSTALAKGCAHADPLVRDLFARFVPEEKRVKTLGTDIPPESILGHQGDAARGRQLFFQEGGAQCFTCHRVEGQGRDFGPDLSRVGRKFTRARMLEQLLQPSKLIESAYTAYSVETHSGASHTGFIVKKSAAGLVLKTANAEALVIPASEVGSTEKQKLSLMPEQILQSFTAQQAADLLQFLSSLR